MARTDESAVQRLQVGLVGLLAVLIFVSIASMILSRTDSPSQPVEASENGAMPGEEAPKEAPVELGVTPVVPEQTEKTPQTGAAPKN
jgi:hypothetical protein